MATVTKKKKKRKKRKKKKKNKEKEKREKLKRKEKRTRRACNSVLALCGKSNCDTNSPKMIPMITPLTLWPKLCPTVSL